MSGYLTNQVLSPPDLPPYLESVYKLKPIVGEPSDEEVIGIHAVIRVASKVVDGKPFRRDLIFRAIFWCSSGRGGSIVILSVVRTLVQRTNR